MKSCAWRCRSLFTESDNSTMTSRKWETRKSKSCSIALRGGVESRSLRIRTSLRGEHADDYWLSGLHVIPVKRAAQVEVLSAFARNEVQEWFLNTNTVLSTQFARRRIRLREKQRILILCLSWSAILVLFYSEKLRTGPMNSIDSAHRSPSA